MTPLERAIAIINNSARIENISGDQLGVTGANALYVVTNPADVARAVLEAIREPSEAMKKAGAFCEPFMTESGAKPMTPGQIIACACYDAMIDAALSEKPE